MLYLEEDSANKNSSIDRLANVHELGRLTYEYEEIGLEGFLENMALVSDQDTLPENVEAPTLLTLHAAKGLEFPIVFIVGLDQDILPHSRSQNDPEELAEERRLFYVGITRAENQLYLTRADRRTTFGQTNETLPSEFLNDIPDQLLEIAGRPGTTRHHRRSSQSGYTSWDQSNFRPTTYATRTTRKPGGGRAKPKVEQKYRSGMRVHSAKWGEGIVLDSRVIGGEETVDIAFEDYGLKKVLADIVKLDILD
jgi:DNA helicase-2/ATP-dependent DNA helicase PcrA